MQQRILSVAAALLALTLGGTASAQCSCSSQQVTDGTGAGNANLTAALTNNTVCVAKAGGGWENQEAHVAGGALVDYKLGTNPVDPRTQVGTWAISGTGTATAVSHTYGSTTYTWKVCTTKANGKPVAGDSIGFCSNGAASSSITATLKAGTNTPC